MIGGIKERSVSKNRPPTAPTPGRPTGFPRAEHRSKKSAFLQSRQQDSSSQWSFVSSAPSVSSSSVPAVPFSPPSQQPPSAQDDVSIRNEIGKQNDDRLQGMSAEEIESERQDILERFGPGFLELVKRAKEVQSARKEKQDAVISDVMSSASVPQEASSSTGSPPQIEAQRPRTPPPNPIVGSLKGGRLSPTFSRPTTPNKKIRFADVTDRDVHVYESQPSSPKRKAIALPARSADDLDVVSIPVTGRVRVNAHVPSNSPPLPSDTSSPPTTITPRPVEQRSEEEEGTPEDIRRRFFPSANPHDPALEWISGTSDPSSSSPSSDPNTPSLDPAQEASQPRFDLSGDPIPSHLLDTLPTHLGLHHHAGTLAGYTLPDLLHLARSTAPAQRASMLDVLASLLLHLRTGKTSKGTKLDDEGELMEVAGRERWRERIMAVGVEGLSARGMVGVRAVDVVLQGVVGWDGEDEDEEGVSVEREQLAPPADVAAISAAALASTNNSSSANPQAQKPTPAQDPISSLPLPHILSTLTNEFTPQSSTLPRSSLIQLLHVLHRLAIHSRSFAHQILDAPGLLSGMLSSFVLRAVELEGSDSESESGVRAAEEAIDVLDTIAQASRRAALIIVEEGYPEQLLRFIVLLPSSSSTTNDDERQSRDHALRIVARTLRLWATLGKYGLFTSIAAHATQGLNALHNLFITSLGSISSPPSLLSGLMIAYVKLMETWLTCARDPHCTTPAHDIRWSQVSASGWGWGEDLIVLYEAWKVSSSSSVSTSPSVSSSGREVDKEDAHSARLAGALWNALAAFLEGASVNAPRGGEVERRAVSKAIAGGFEDQQGVERRFVRRAIDALKQNVGASSVVQIAEAAAVLQSCLRLVLAFAPPAKGPDAGVSDEQVPPPLKPDLLEEIHRSSFALLSNSSWARLTSHPRTHVRLRSLTSLTATSLRLVHALKLGSPLQWMSEAFLVLRRLLPGDEEQGSWLVSAILDLIDTQPDIVGSLGWTLPPDMLKREGDMGLKKLAPMLSAAFLPRPEPSSSSSSAEQAGEEEEAALADPVSIAPYTSTPLSIAHSTRITYPSSSQIASSDGGYGLPIAPDWPFAPVNALLRGNASGGAISMLAHLTGEGEGDGPSLSELDVVRAMLIFAGLYYTHTPEFGEDIHSYVLFGCMRVFMLEFGVKEDDSAGEVFRDTFVQNAMLALLSISTRRRQPRPTSTSNSSSAPSIVTSSNPATLEKVSARFLGPRTPFYQFYTDFVGLYDAISYSDPLFSSLLLPPLAMSYPGDYRTLFWIDHPHLARLVRTEVEHPAVSAAVNAFLWPVEEDGRLIDAYVSALGRTSVKGLLRDIAVHHVRCTMWAGLGKEGDAEKEASELKKRTWAQRLSVLVGAPPDVVKDVVLYTRLNEGEATSVLSDEQKRRRRARVDVWGGPALGKRLEGLLGSA